RLATEHPLVEDNGDGLGTPPDWFRGVLAVKRAADGAASDGTLAHQMHLVRSAAEQSLAPADRARYRPDAAEDARRDGAAWWRTQQERGLVRRSP
ncbi:MAG: hypothetical protein EBW56_05730, partial [Burkholderiaceae bacterium]|nr:hypothetical protein [Burkholderiaceae bacterium]